MRQNESKISKIEINPVTQINSKLMKCTKMNENESKLTKIERINPETQNVLNESKLTQIERIH